MPPAQPGPSDTRTVTMSHLWTAGSNLSNSCRCPSLLDDILSFWFLRKSFSPKLIMWTQTEPRTGEITHWFLSCSMWHRAYIGGFFFVLLLNFSEPCMLQPVRVSQNISFNIPLWHITVLLLIQCYVAVQWCQPSVVTVSQWGNCQLVFTRCFI